jgi:uncharacterized protein YuzE
MIKKTYDPEVDTFYISCKIGKVAKTEDKGDYLVDYDSKGDVLGYEILNYCEVGSRLRVINGIPLIPPYGAKILYTAPRAHKLNSENMGNQKISAVSNSEKTKDNTRQILNV